MENGGKPLKVLYQLVQKFYPLFYILMLPIVIHWVKVSFTQYIYHLEIYLHGAEIDRMQNNYWVICQ